MITGSSESDSLLAIYLLLETKYRASLGGVRKNANVVTPGQGLYREFKHHP